jgi:tetratricopeptide (TPR) repeat protein
MHLLDTLPVAWLQRPYFDLGSSNTGSLHHYGIEFTYKSLTTDISISPGVQVNISPLFREELIQATGLHQYRIKNPISLPDELQTERWKKLCDFLVNYNELETSTRVKVVNTLRSLCFHEAVLDYVPRMSASEISSSTELAALAWCRAVSNRFIHYDYSGTPDLNEIENIAINAPRESRTRINASLLLVVEYANSSKDVESAEFWRSFAENIIQEIRPDLSDFEYNLLMSVYYRSVSFVPFLHNDKDRLIEEMDLCEFHGKNLFCESEHQQIIARENFNLLTESRAKEALWLGDVDLAEERTRLLVQREPLDPRYHLELGEILIKQHKIEESLKIYRSAARLGPPGTQIAWFMAGQCHESLNELDIACDCYLASLQLDPEAISALEKLTELAPKIGNTHIEGWSNTRLNELKKQQKSIMNQVGNYCIPVSASELKIAGQKAFLAR